MIQSLSFILIIAFSLLSLCKGYDIPDVTSCSIDTKQQSPINIEKDKTFYFDEKYFRFLTNNYDLLTENNTWTYFKEEMAVGIAPSGNQIDFGSFIFVRDWAMYSYRLKKILFRTPSEHTLEGEKFDAEMQLIHTVDGNYYPPGRRIDLQGVDYLVISVLFKVTDDNNPAKSLLFHFMNLEKGIDANMIKPIKLFHIIQHQPSYLYTGSLTYPECQKSLWLVFSQFHLIGQTDFNNLKNLIQKATGLENNARDIFSNNFDEEVFRNWNDKVNLIPKQTLMVYSSSSMLNMSYTFLMSIFFFALMIIF
jgi:carbonic anhydrase